MQLHGASSKPWRETPLVHSQTLSRAAGCKVYLKLENIQPSGSFKSRGMGYYMLARLKEQHEKHRGLTTNGHSDASPSDPHAPVHFYCSSGGNAGLAAVHAAVSLQRPCTVVVPLSTKAHMVAKLRAAGAHAVVQEGASWAEADAYLRQELLAHDKGGIYVPPFDHPDVWAGNSTMVAEIKDQLAEQAGRDVVPDAVVCSVGGGGLLCGVAQGLDALGAPWDKVRVLAVETAGADSLSASLQTGELITIPAITSQATSLGARRVAAQAFAVGRRENVRSVVLSDAEAAMGCWRLADEERVLVELSCGVNVALCYDGRLRRVLGKTDLNPDSVVVIVLCGGSNVSLEMVQAWKEEFAAAPELRVPAVSTKDVGH